MATLWYVAAGLQMCSVEGMSVFRFTVKNDGRAKVFPRLAIQGIGVIAGCPIRIVQDVPELPIFNSNHFVTIVPEIILAQQYSIKKVELMNKFHRKNEVSLEHLVGQSNSSWKNSSKNHCRRFFMKNVHSILSRNL